VSQFWTYKPEEFPKAPAYDRNYPPIETTRRLRLDALRI
jgi:hypothetical protein